MSRVTVRARRMWHGTNRRGQPGSAYQSPARLLHPKKDLDAKGVLESCGRCHYKHIWRYAIDEDPRVGFNEIAISQNHDSLGFFADGRLSGLELQRLYTIAECVFQGRHELFELPPDARRQALGDAVGRER